MHFCNSVFLADARYLKINFNDDSMMMVVIVDNDTVNQYGWTYISGGHYSTSVQKPGRKCTVGWVICSIGVLNKVTVRREILWE